MKACGWKGIKGTLLSNALMNRALIRVKKIIISRPVKCKGCVIREVEKSCSKLTQPTKALPLLQVCVFVYVKVCVTSEIFTSVHSKTYFLIIAGLYKEIFKKISSLL